ncbi:flavin reductase (DIM6/NTAB) family NADH-FMN oxidoreductase RutF [Catalinimonas alkaloidigena]|uniref:flavin reductase family protein n=1 Tax=Catalinimonas alkaloidigena TaxID=1075417 RepID=UPI00240551FB|nr:flavin reductase family protein [Catalinimonas alkaloidigena]MDF9794803.1 flavin reductase (DIM6/NTAB) family NADH-FMN oxidoreductase RutF [Catalinimonas alkaloidigena]
MSRVEEVSKHNEVSQALKKITYGFYIVTSRKNSDEMSTREKDYIAAATVSWVSQGSFDPPLVTLAVKKQSDLHETIEKSRVFAVNIIGKDHKDMLSSFAKDSSVEGNKINGFSFSSGKTGAPILDEVPAYFECELREDVTIGDHSIFVGEVVAGDTRDAESVPLVEWDTNMHYGG